MADLCELIIKVGKKPSIQIIHKKDSIAKFKNKECKRNNNVYQIRELHKIYNNLRNIKKEIINYNDFAYCVELEKNHVVLAKRKGKIIWSGNCIHVLSVYFKEAHTKKQVKEMSDFSQGKIKQHPFRKGLLPSDDIAGRIAKAKGARTVTREMRNEAARLKREFKKIRK
jgi:hypothetical protein